MLSLSLRSPPMQAYLWTKTAHLVFVMAWMAGVFYLPRILVNLAEAGDQPRGARAAAADGASGCTASAT